MSSHSRSEDLDLMIFASRHRAPYFADHSASEMFLDMQRSEQNMSAMRVENLDAMQWRSAVVRTWYMT